VQSKVPPVSDDIRSSANTKTCAVRDHVRFGSKADICGAPAHVRFAPHSDRESSFLTFLIMQAVIRGTLGISLPQNLNASCSQAHRCSTVPSACDFPASATLTIATLATTARHMLIFVMATS